MEGAVESTDPLIYDYPYSSLTVYQAPIRQALLCRPLLSFVELFVMAKMVTRGDAVAQSVDSSVSTSCRPRFESQAHHIRFFIYSICAIFVM